MPSTDPPDEFWTDRAHDEWVRAYDEWRQTAQAEVAAPAEPQEALPPQTSIGAASLMRIHRVGRPAPSIDDLEQPDEVLEDGTKVWVEPRAPGTAIPPQCLRVLSSPLPLERGGGCINHYGSICPGTQRDGGCLADVVRRAQEQGKDWKFEVVREIDIDPPDPPEGRWVYCGDPLDDAE